MSDKKKMGTWSFFKALGKAAITGDTAPIAEVLHDVKKGIDDGNEKEEGPKVVETTGEEVQEAPPRGNPNDEGA